MNNEEQLLTDEVLIALQYASALVEVWVKASVIKDSLTQVSSILEKDCIHKEMYDTIALSMQQIMNVVQTTIAMSELDKFTVLY